MMKAEACIALIEQRLVEKLLPSVLHIVDESAEHIGHAGAQNGGAHFHITIASTQFADQSRLYCHRLVYLALNDLIGKEIHAVRITTC